jgi:hypothetical protein
MRLPANTICLSSQSSAMYSLVSSHVMGLLLLFGKLLVVGDIETLVLECEGRSCDLWADAGVRSDGRGVCRELGGLGVVLVEEVGCGACVRDDRRLSLAGALGFIGVSETTREGIGWPLCAEASLAGVADIGPVGTCPGGCMECRRC